MPHEKQNNGEHVTRHWSNQDGAEMFGGPKIRRELLERTEDGRHLYHEVFGALALGDTKKVADIGCYDGDDELELVIEYGHTGQLVGIEVPLVGGMAIEDDPRFDFSHYFIHEHDIKNIEFKYGYAQDLPLWDGTMDAVMALWSLFGVPPEQLDKAIGEIHRVLRVVGRTAIASNGADNKPKHHNVLYEMAEYLGADYPGPLSKILKFEDLVPILESRFKILSEVEQRTRLPLDAETMPIYKMSIDTYRHLFDPIPDTKNWQEAKKRALEKIETEISRNGVAFDEVHRGYVIAEKK